MFRLSHHVAADAEADRGSRCYDVGIRLVRAHLTYIAVDIYGRLPGSTAIQLTRDQAGWRDSACRRWPACVDQRYSLHRLQRDQTARRLQ